MSFVLAMVLAAQAPQQPTPLVLAPMPAEKFSAVATSTPVPLWQQGLVWHEALDEVNLARARRGLRPYLPDPLLTQAAARASTLRAYRLIDGHLPESDFSYVPPGGHASSAGCAAWEPGWGWGSCCTYDNYTFAGAAWAMGRDGKRYMHLYVR